MPVTSFAIVPLPNTRTGRDRDQSVASLSQSSHPTPPTRPTKLCRTPVPQIMEPHTTLVSIGNLPVSIVCYYYSLDVPENRTFFTSNIHLDAVFRQTKRAPSSFSVQYERTMTQQCFFLSSGERSELRQLSCAKPRQSRFGCHAKYIRFPWLTFWLTGAS